MTARRAQTNHLADPLILFSLMQVILTLTIASSAPTLGEADSGKIQSTIEDEKESGTKDNCEVRERRRLRLNLQRWC